MLCIDTYPLNESIVENFNYCYCHHSYCYCYCYCYRYYPYYYFYCLLIPNNKTPQFLKEKATTHPPPPPTKPTNPPKHKKQKSKPDSLHSVILQTFFLMWWMWQLRTMITKWENHNSDILYYLEHMKFKQVMRCTSISHTTQWQDSLNWSPLIKGIKKQICTKSFPFQTEEMQMHTQHAVCSLICYPDTFS